MELTQHEIRSYYQTRIPGLRMTSQREWRRPCPVHNGKDLNFSINSETGLSHCHSQCGRDWDIVAQRAGAFGSRFQNGKEPGV